MISVAIVDDHDAIRLGFRGACAKVGYQVLADARSVSELLENLAGQHCDVVVLDLSLADGSEVRNNVETLMASGARVLIYSIADKVSLVRAAIRAGAVAVVTKGQTMDELLEAIELSAAGIFVNNTLTTSAIEADAEFKSRIHLSPREREVLELYASGLTLKQVAFQLGIKANTVKEHIDRVREKYANDGRPVASKSDLLLRLLEDENYQGGLI